MATDIILEMKDGTARKFLHSPRAGGSYTKKIRYDGDFAITTDEFYNETAIPSSDIKEIKVKNYGY
ncbi:MAG: hypothetical protein LLG40_13990 [Deltaproteobacteria bacterium]|nr:hypothetical protein [Deltaproteobacteria bacterium]